MDSFLRGGSKQFLALLKHPLEQVVWLLLAGTGCFLADEPRSIAGEPRSIAGEPQNIADEAIGSARDIGKVIKLGAPQSGSLRDRPLNVSVQAYWHAVRPGNSEGWSLVVQFQSLFPR